ncbi:hypothetical protein FQZ97_366840 [compost metagenome]
MQVVAVRQQRLLPEGHVAVRRRRAGLVQGGRPCAQAVQACQRCLQRLRRGGLGQRQFGLQALQRLVVEAGGEQRVAQHLEAVGQPGEQLRVDRRGVRQRQQAGAQGEQQPGQVAAVHRRHVVRRQGLQGLRVVPVVEVPAMALQPGHAGQRAVEAFQQAPGAQVAEVVGGQVREQRHAHVGRRGAVGDDGGGLLLQVVGWQPVVRRADMLVEERPGLARQPAQEAQLGGRRCERRPRRRPAEPPGDGRAGQPEQQERAGQGLRDGCVQQQGAQRQGQRGGDPHQPVQPGQVVAAGALHFARGIPLQQAALAEQHAPQRAGNGVQAVQRLVGQPDQRQQGPREMQAGRARGRRQVLAERDVVGFLQQLQQRAEQRLGEDQDEHREGPGKHLGHAEPAPQQHAQERRRLQAAPQVVEDLPARQGAEAVAFQAAVRFRRPRQKPRQQLPVAANPAVPAFHVGAVARRVFLVQLHVAEQAGARIAALDQVVAEDAVVGKAAFQRLLEGVHRVDALADERAVAEQVLVDVRDGAGIGVDAGVAAEQLGVGRTRGARQADADPRLEDRVAGADAPPPWVEHRAVERVGHGADELPRHVARQLRVGVQGDDVGHRRQRRDIADDQRETLQAPAAQQGIELGDLAAFALMAHPHPLGRVPASRAVQQEEAFGVDGGVFAVQRLDALARQPQQRGVLFEHLAGGVHEVGEQGEMQVAVAVGEKAHLEALDQLLDVPGVGHQRGDHHQGARLGRDAVAVVQARQDVRGDGEGHQPVDQADGQAAGHQQRRHGQAGQQVAGQAVAAGGVEERPGEQQGEDQHRTEEEQQRRAAQQALPALHQRYASGEPPLQFAAPGIHQVEADVPGHRAVGRGAGIGRGQRDGCARHLFFRVRAVARQALDHMAVVVAGGEIHAGVDRRRVFLQHLLDAAHALDEGPPVGGREQAQAADAVADGHLVGGLLLGVHLHQALDAQPRLGEHLLDPGQRQDQRGALALQAARQFGDERAGHRRFRARQVGHGEDHALGIALGGGAQAVGPVVGQVAVVPVGHHPRGHAAQVLDQRQAQHDGDRPQLAEGQRHDALVSHDEAAQALAVDPPVAMGDGFQGDVVDPWQAGRRAIGQAWQLAAVALGQVFLRGADLFFDQVEVVQQPFRRRRGAPAGARRGGERRAAAGQDGLVVGQPREQRVRRRARAQAVLPGQLGAVAGHLLGTEQLGAQGRFVVEFPRRGAPVAQGRDQAPQGECVEPFTVHGFLGLPCARPALASVSMEALPGSLPT